jgi:hypothetical protein
MRTVTNSLIFREILSSDKDTRVPRRKLSATLGVPNYHLDRARVKAAIRHLATTAALKWERRIQCGAHGKRIVQKKLLLVNGLGCAISSTDFWTAKNEAVGRILRHSREARPTGMNLCSHRHALLPTGSAGTCDSTLKQCREACRPGVPSSRDCAREERNRQTAARSSCLDM